MKIRQWEIWKAKPPDFQTEHWFVIISGQERCDETRQLFINGLACFTLRGELRKSEVRLNSADGFATATTCQCDFLYSIPKAMIHSSLGMVSWERQQQIKNKIREVHRF